MKNRMFGFIGIEKFIFLWFSFSLLFSYADYARIPSNDYGYPLAQRACEK
jgi:hypothetical protein